MDTQREISDSVLDLRGCADNYVRVIFVSLYT